MRKLLSSLLAGGIAAAAMLLASLTANSQDFAVSIVGLQQSWQYEGLPMVYYAPNPRSRSRPLGPDMGESSDYSFFVVVQNVQKVADKITMGASVWYDSLQFTLRTSSGKIYSVFHAPSFIWSANPQEKWLFRSGGLRVIPVDFTNKSWRGLPPLEPPDEVLSMTVTFRYFDSKGKSVSVTSSPTDVYLYSI
jgi:hypothetical protein